MPLAQLIAPPGKFRIVGIDKFHWPMTDHWLLADCDDLEEALERARQLTREAAGLSTSPEIATVYYVYDDEGHYRGGDIYTEE